MTTTRSVVSAAMIFCLALLSSCASQPPSGPNLPVETTMNTGAGGGDLLLIPLHLKSGDDLLFILDTGAPLTLLDSSLTQGLGKQVGHEKIISMYGQTPSHYYRAPELYWGDVRLHTGQRVLTMDLSRLSGDLTRYTHSSHRLMGILGMDCLWHYSIQLDFVARRIRFLDPSQLHREDLGESFSLIPDDEGCPTTVGKRGSRCLIDTGCVGRSATNVMGLDFLSRHLVTFDFSERKMYLKPATLSHFQLESKMPNTALEPTPTAP